MTDYPNNIPAKLEIIKAMIDLSDSDKEILTKAASGFAVGMGGMEATLDFAKWFDYGTDAKGQKRAEVAFEFNEKLDEIDVKLILFEKNTAI